MRVKAVEIEAFGDYKYPAMLIGANGCDWKCERECGERLCQNSSLASSPAIDIAPYRLLELYQSSTLTRAIIFGGLEPMLQIDEVESVIKCFRKNGISDPIIIYTGYNPPEIEEQLNILRRYKNIIVKFGRFVPGQKPHMDKVLGVMLASDNQYAVQLTEEENS